MNKMQKPDYNSPTSLKNFLVENEFAMQKKFGQNFLVNQSAREKLIAALDISENTNVWEVGPGLGSMTEMILNAGAVLTVFEIDKGFAAMIAEFFSDKIESGKFKIVEGDVLKTWQKELANAHLANAPVANASASLHANAIPQRFFGNLPYNIAAALIADTIEKNIRFEKCVFTIQKEVAERMCAKPDSQSYSSFSVLCQWAYNVKTLFDLAGGNFWPRPAVESRAVILTPREDFPRCKNPAHFIKMQRSLFSMRRKNLRNTMTHFLGDAEKAEAALAACGIDSTKRAETLSIDTLLQLSDTLNSDII